MSREDYYREEELQQMLPSFTNMSIAQVEGSNNMRHIINNVATLSGTKPVTPHWDNLPSSRQQVFKHPTRVNMMNSRPPSSQQSQLSLLARSAHRQSSL